MLFILRTHAKHPLVGFVGRAATLTLGERRRALVKPFKYLARSLIKRRCRLAALELRQLDDHTRRDIGLSRSGMD